MSDDTIWYSLVGRAVMLSIKKVNGQTDKAVKGKSMLLTECLFF